MAELSQELIDQLNAANAREQKRIKGRLAKDPKLAAEVDRLQTEDTRRAYGPHRARKGPENTDQDPIPSPPRRKGRKGRKA